MHLEHTQYLTHMDRLIIEQGDIWLIVVVSVKFYNPSSTFIDSVLKELRSESSDCACTRKCKCVKNSALCSRARLVWTDTIAVSFEVQQAFTAWVPPYHFIKLKMARVSYPWSAGGVREGAESSLHFTDLNCCHGYHDLLFFSIILTLDDVLKVQCRTSLSSSKGCPHRLAV